MLHKRYVVRWIEKTRWDDDTNTAFCSDLTYLDRSDAVAFADLIKERLGAKHVQINEFIADFAVPAVLIPSAWLNKY